MVSSFLYDFFLSYDRAECGDFVHRLCAELTKVYNTRVYIDERVPTGEGWEKTLREAMTHSRIVVAVLSSQAAPSPYVTSEVQIAINLVRSDGRRKIVWVDIGEPAINPNELILGLQGFQGITATDAGGVNGVAERLFKDHYPVIEQSPDQRRGVTLFSSRDRATSAMLEDMEKATHAYFLGVSHRKLWSYLSQVADETKQDVLPLQHVEVFFANKDLGNLLEPNEFSSNVREAMLKVATVLKSHPRFADPHVAFFKFPNILTPSGCRFKRLNHSQHNNLPFSVIYNVFMERGVDLSVAWTMSMRYSKCDPSERDIFRREVVNFERLSRTKKFLFSTAEKNLWDKSNTAWHQFQLEHPVYETICRALWRLGEVHKNHNVLDFGSGTGTSLQTLALEHTHGSLTLVDASPGMLDIAGKLYAKHRQVEVILADARFPLPGNFPKHSCDRITSCLSLQAFADDLGSINKFAANCKRYLAKDGRVVIGVHNSFIACDRPKGFENWEDPLRAEICQELTSRSIPIRPTQGSPRKFEQREIVEEFESVGLHCEQIESLEVPRSIYDRVAMWRTPAVFDSIVDMRRIETKTHHEVLMAAGKSCRKERTMPTTVVMMCFRV